ANIGASDMRVALTIASRSSGPKIGLDRHLVRLEHIDMLRGLAAVLVMAGHLRAFVFSTFASLNNPDVTIKLFYGLTGLGHQAVIVFFAMSGFLVGGKALDDMISGRWSWARYLVRRLSRLWIVLIPALITTAILDEIGIALTSGVGYDGSLYD